MRRLNPDINTRTGTARRNRFRRGVRIVQGLAKCRRERRKSDQKQTQHVRSDSPYAAEPERLLGVLAMPGLRLAMNE
jgi:hypothetical protein